MSCSKPQHPTTEDARMKQATASLKLDLESLADSISTHSFAEEPAREAKHSFGDSCQTVDEFMTKYKVLSTITHMLAFLKSDSAKAKLGVLISLFELHSVGSSRESIVRLMEHTDLISALFKTVTTAYAEETIPTIDPEKVAEGLQQAAVDGLTFDTTKPLEQQESSTQEWIDTMDAHMGIIRPLLGVMMFFACAFGFSKILEFSFLGDMSKSMVQLSTNIRAKNVVKKEMDKSIDSVLSTIYGAFGKDYVSPDQKRVQDLNVTIAAAEKWINDYDKSVSCDLFGALREWKLPQYEAFYEKLQHQYNQLTVNEKSLVNFAERFRRIGQKIDEVKRRVNEIRGGAAKQEPVVTWIWGEHGVGKSELAKLIMATIEKGATMYSRNPLSEYWDGYYGQAAVLFDDILQHADEKDVADFHRAVGGIAFPLNKAQVNEKGTPFTSRYIFATSNVWGMDSSKLQRSVGAFNRRRDYIVHAHNPAMAEWRKVHGQESPPGTWFAQHPTEYHLYKHSPDCNTAIVLERSAANPCYIGPVTAAQLAIMVHEKQKARSHQYADALIKIGLIKPEDGPHLEPYNADAFSCATIYQNGVMVNPPVAFNDIKNPTLRERQMEEYLNKATLGPSSAQELETTFALQGRTGQPVEDQLTQDSTASTVASDEEPSASEGEADDSDDDGEFVNGKPFTAEPGEEQILLTPAIATTFPKRWAVLLGGEPGMGKTEIVNKVKLRHQNGAGIVEVKPSNFRDFKIKDHGGKIVIVDDFTTTSAFTEFLRGLVMEFHEGRTGLGAVIATFNPETNQWKKDMKKHEKTQLLGRSATFDFSLDLKIQGKRMFSSKDLRTYIEDCVAEQNTTQQEWRDKHVIIRRNGVRDCKPSGLATIVEHEMCRGRTEVRVETRLFEIPMPSDYDFHINLPLNPFGPAPLQPRQVISAIFSGQCQALRRVNGVMRPMAYGEFVEMAAPVLGMVTGTQAYGTLDMFLEIFNKERHLAPFTYTVVAQLENATIVFIPVKDGQKNIVCCAKVDPDTLQVVSVEEDRVYLDGELVAFDEHNDVYRKAAIAAFSTSEYRKAEIATEKEVERQYLRHVSRLGQFLTDVIPIASVVLKGFAAAAMLSECCSSSDTPVETEARTISRSVASSYDGNVRGQKKHDTDAKRLKDFEALLGEQKQQIQALQAQLEARSSVPASSVSASSYDPKTGQKKARENPSKRLLDFEGSEEEATAYDGTPRTRQIRVRDIEATFNKDGTVMMLGTKPGFRDIGVYFKDQVFYGHEATKGVWNMITVPYNPEWQVIDVTTLKCKYNNKPFSFEFKEKQFDINAIKHLQFKTVACDLGETGDVSSIVAFSFAHGAPYDIDAEAMRPDLVSKIFDPSVVYRKPHALERVFQTVFPEWHAKFPEVTIKEGMVDERQKEYFRIIGDISGSILWGGKHAVFGVQIGDDKILTVKHVKSLGNLQFVDNQGEVWDLTHHYDHPTADLAVYAVKHDKTHPYTNKKHKSHLFISRADLRRVVAASSKGFAAALVTPPCRNQTEWAEVFHCTASVPLTAKGSTNMDGVAVTYHNIMPQVHHTGVTTKGDCGSLLMITNKTIDGKIVALHHSGNTSMSIGALITKDFIEEILGVAKESGQPQCAVTAPIFPKELELFPVAKACDQSGVPVVGCIADGKGIHMPTSTRICRTGIEVPEINHCEPSVMSKFDPRAKEHNIDPFTTGIKRYNTIVSDVLPPADEINAAMVEIGNHLCNVIQCSGRKVRVLTQREAVNGPDRMDYPGSKPIDRTGAVGFPYNITSNLGKSKGDFLYQHRDGESDHHWYFKDHPEAKHLQSDINTIVQNARQRKVQVHAMIAYCKDEVLKKKKTRGQGIKTRLFFSPSFPYLVAFRRYYLAALLRIMENFSTIPIKVGISGSSTDWHFLGCRLAQMGHSGFASDLESFDASVHIAWMEAAMIPLNMIYQRCSEVGENVEEGNIVRETLHKALEGAYVLGKKTLYKLNQAQVSGNPATAIENSLIIWALYYVIWKRLALIHDPLKATFDDFRANVEIAIYGDDNVCTVAPSIKWFNFNSFKRVAKDLGFSVTDAAKTGEDVADFIPLQEMEFLKRGFVKQQGFWTGPLDLTSIGKTIHWIRDKNYEVTAACIPEEGGEWPTSDDFTEISSSINRCFRELALHGKEKYERYRDLILDSASKRGIQLDPPTWLAACRELGFYFCE